ncbi:TPA: L-rhamnose mutarotase [Klebsiella aerogenes]|uniref:L-rhamnose mutarotase n=1 Tax=Klebsiella aerogenes TaxID=548 RepID=UPI002296B900|nr:L-rhamnose mutarotase [Klebsiella aerogenes]MDM8056182.1 L-rhamnose mutarotase [Klebsiella aerogenes]MDM8081862.1 L-rhamnose mutarotase [Klebsiella aerogenes]HBW4584748.1 L-rhamnose mutarotase [Klebsiella aerogenes]HCT3748532.1 L-rhamnose mutarotase [Klebsiella aerogenes]HCT8624602.1 L-rhamnose mutarotase [Klebsiella aerogenes]
MNAIVARRRLCQALDLVDSAEKIAEYQRLHERIWPEVSGHLRAHGVLDMEIYRLGTRLFMVMEVAGDFDGERFAQHSLNHPVIQRWEALMWQYQVPTPWTPAGEKWVSMERIFSLQDQ